MKQSAARIISIGQITHKVDFAEHIGRMKSMINNLSETVDDFTKFLKPEKERLPFAVKKEINRVLNLMDERVRLSHISTEVKGAEITVTGYRNEFGQCLFNLLDNARDALEEELLENRKIVVTTGIESNKAGSSLGHVIIFNRGKHIAENNKDRIFDLYFTTKEDRGGTGIGLYLTKEIIETHFSGNVSFENVEDGVCFDITVPLAIEEGDAQ